MRYDIARHAAAGGHARMAGLDPETRHEFARRAGKARMAGLNEAERTALAQRGLAGLANRHFGGDLHAALTWLTAKGLHLQDPGRGTTWELYPDPGPLPSSIQGQTVPVQDGACKG